MTDIQLVEPTEQRIEQQGVGFEVGFTVRGFEHLLVGVEGAIEEEFSAAAESDYGVV